MTVAIKYQCVCNFFISALESEIHSQSLPLVDSHYLVSDFGGITLFTLFPISNHIELYRIILFL